MATMQALTTLADSANANTYTSSSFTPTGGTLLVVSVYGKGTISEANLTASGNGITFSRAQSMLGDAGNARTATFIADQLLPASPASMTVSVDYPTDPAVGSFIFVSQLTGMTKTGLAALVQAAGTDSNLNTGQTPTVTFNSAPASTNPVYTWVGTNSNPTGLNPPSGLVELVDAGYTSPNTGAQACASNSGSAQTLTWDTTSTRGVVSGFEFDASGGGGGGGTDLIGSAELTGSGTLAGSTSQAQGSLNLSGSGTLRGKDELLKDPTPKLLTYGSSTNNGTSFTTESVTPTPNAVQLLSVMVSVGSGEPPAPTVSGAGMNWVLNNTSSAPTARKNFQYRAMSANPSTGTLTISSPAGETYSSAIWTLTEYTNVDTSGADGSGAIGQTEGFASNGSVTTESLSAPPAAGSAVHASTSINYAEAITVDSPWMELIQKTENSPDSTMISCYSFPGEQTVTFRNVTGGTTRTTMTVVLPAPASTNLTGTASLSGSGTLSGIGKPAVSGTANLTGSGSLTTAGKPAVSGTVNLTGSGTLAPAGKPTPKATVALTGSGTLTTASETVYTGTVNLTGSGTLTTAGKPAVSGTVNLTGSGALTTAGKPAVSGTANLTGSGTLTAAGLPVVSGTVNLTGSGSLTTAGKPAVSGTVNLTGSGTLVTASEAIYTGTVDLTGSGTLAVAGEPAVAGMGNLTGSGTLTAAGKPAVAGTVNLTGSGTLVTVGAPAPIATVNLTGSGTLVASGAVTPTATVNLTGSGTLTTASELAVSGTVNLTGSGTLSSASETVYTGTAELTGSGTLAATGAPTPSAVVNLTGSGTLSTAGIPDVIAGLALNGDGTLVAQAFATTAGTAELAGEGLLEGYGEVKENLLGTAELTGEGLLELAATADVTALGYLTGEGFLTAQPTTGTVQWYDAATGTLRPARVLGWYDKPNNQIRPALLRGWWDATDQVIRAVK